MEGGGGPNVGYVGAANGGFGGFPNDGGAAAGGVRMPGPDGFYDNPQAAAVAATAAAAAAGRGVRLPGNMGLPGGYGGGLGNDGPYDHQ